MRERERERGMGGEEGVGRRGGRREGETIPSGRKEGGEIFRRGEAGGRPEK